MNTNFYGFKGGLNPEMFALAGSCLLNGTDAPTTLLGDIQSVSRTSEGLFAVQLAGRGALPQRLEGAVQLEGDVDPKLSAMLVSVDKAARIATVKVKTAGEKSTGLITCLAKADMVDTDYMKIFDGVSAAGVLYEFDVAGDGATAGRVQVDISGATTSADVAAILAPLIASNQPLLSVTDNLDGTISITHKLAGVVGNATMTENVADAGFLVSGMSGGEDAGVQDVALADAIRLNVRLWCRNITA